MQFPALATVAIASLAHAGPLTPPPGAPSDTLLNLNYKTTAQIEPRVPLTQDTTPGDADCVFRITQPGSYYLTAGFSFPSGDSGIIIAANDVTLDLNGFVITGESGSVDAIQTDSVFTGLTVLNGRVQSAGRHGVNDEFVQGVRVHNVHARQCGDVGIRVLGESAVITDCHADSNDGNGFVTGPNAALARCTATRNDGDGFDVGDGSAVHACTARFSGGEGIRAGAYCAITDCTASGTGSIGIRVGGNSVVARCTAEGGFTAAGVNAGQGSVVYSCAARVSQRDGFFIATSVHIEGCVALNNGRHGIAASNGAYILNNISSFNDDDNLNGAGISVTGTANRIEGNTCNDQRFGYLIANDDNLVIRNSAHGNTTNYSIDPGATFGQIITTFLGGQIPTPDPWANFEY